MPAQIFGDNHIGITELGGIAVKLNNGSGAPSVKGTIVKADVNADDSFDIAAAGEPQPIGIVYDDGIADGSECWVIIYGIADVLLKDTTASVHGNWVYTSDVAGRADATLLVPPGGGIPELDIHMGEVGHAIESIAGGADVLARVCLHFN